MPHKCSDAPVDTPQLLLTAFSHAAQAQYFFVMGWHWGASVAFNTARAWPQRMLRLVLAAPPISDPAIIRFFTWAHCVALHCAAPCRNMPLSAVSLQVIASLHAEAMH
jgi:pimeloyl-ACP methyl ester carboxylesterase